jgi:serine/threonine protein kinase
MALELENLPDEVKDVLALCPEFNANDFNNSGANGYVLTGRQEKLGTEVAIKIYFHEENELEQEPTLIAAIDHENVLRVLDARSLSETCSYYVTPFANYGDLRKYLDGYYISSDWALRLLSQLLSGLSELHSAPNYLVHRDLKPENLLVHEDNILIADFGSVRRVSEETRKTPASKHSILYRPPETFGENAYYDYSSDTYQAGIIGYLLFGGKLDNDLINYMKNPEVRKFEKIKREEGDYEASIYMDSCIAKRINAGKLLNWSSVPLFVPKRVIRTLKRAVSKTGSQYKRASDFLLELQKTQATMPIWMEQNGSWKLENWKGRDYKIIHNRREVKVMKRRSGNTKYITDNALSGTVLASVYSNMANKLGLP